MVRTVVASPRWRHGKAGGTGHGLRHLRQRAQRRTGGWAGVMSAADLAGWGAAGLTMLTFCCRDMHRLRLLALCANGAFIAYGSMAALTPVLVLHLLLAPINSWRLFQLQKATAPIRSDPVPTGVPACPIVTRPTSMLSSVVAAAPWFARRQPAGCTSALRHAMRHTEVAVSPAVHATTERALGQSRRVGVRIGGCSRRGSLDRHAVRRPVRRPAAGLR